MAEPKSISLAGRTTVVTGGAGFLGRVVVRKLKERGCSEVTAPRRSSCDLRRADEVARLLDAAQPDFVIHLASTVDDPASRADVATNFCDNVLMATQLIDAAARRGISKMVTIGSASSYPASASMPLREQDLFNGLPDASRLAHGIAKRLPIIQAYACRLQYAFRCISLIPTNLYGPSDNFDTTTGYVIPSLVRRFVEAAEMNLPEVALRGTGKATRDFLHVEDCAEGILLALERYDGAQPVNLGSGTEVKIADLAQQIARLAGYTGRILWDARYPDGPPRRVLDTSRAQREFGFRARRSLQDGLRETLEWHLSTRHPAILQQDAQAVASSA